MHYRVLSVAQYCNLIALLETEPDTKCKGIVRVNTIGGYTPMKNPSAKEKISYRDHRLHFEPCLPEVVSCCAHLECSPSGTALHHQDKTVARPEFILLESDVIHVGLLHSCFQKMGVGHNAGLAIVVRSVPALETHGQSHHHTLRARILRRDRREPVEWGRLPDPQHRPISGSRHPS